MELHNPPARKWTLAILVALSVSALNAADPLPKVWEISLRDHVAAWGQPPLKDLDVLSLSFSPDGGRLAVSFGNRYRLDSATAGTSTTYLAVLPVEHPETTLFWAELTQTGEPIGSLSAQLLWAPDGNSLVCQNVLIRLPGGERCRVRDWMPDNVGLGWFGGFLSAGRAVFSIPNPSLAHGQSVTFATIDSHCRIVERWHSKRFLFIDGVSPDGRLLTLVEPSRKFLLMEFASKKEIKLSVPRGREVSASPVFFGGGKLVCAVIQRAGMMYRTRVVPWGPSLQPAEPEARIMCWNTQTWKRVFESKHVWKGKGNVVATGIPRVLLAGGSRFAMVDRAQQRWVWDYETDRVIASWMSQNEDGTPVRTPIAVLPVAISPDGRFIADAGAGSVRLYRLP